MRGLEDALARMARRDGLRDRTGSVRPGEACAAIPQLEAAPAPSVNPVVDEVADALRGVVQRHPGVFATVVVQEAETSWSVWIGEWDGVLRTRVTKLDDDPPAPDATPTTDLRDEPTRPLTVPPMAGRPAVPSQRTPLSAVPSGPSLSAGSAAQSLSAASAAAASVPAPAEPDPAVPVIPLPRRRASLRPVPRAAAALPAGPTRRQGNVAEMLRPRHAAFADADLNADAETPALGFRPPLAVAPPMTVTPPPADDPLPLPVRSATLDADTARMRRPAAVDVGGPLPKRIPDTGVPLPRRVPGVLGGLADEQPALPAAPTPLPPPSVPLMAAGHTTFPPAHAPLPTPGVPLAAAAPPALPVAPDPVADDTTWPPLAPSAWRQAAHRAEALREEARNEALRAEALRAEARLDAVRSESRRTDGQQTPALPVPTIPAPPLAAAQRVNGPGMNDRVAGRIADMLRREAKRDNRGLTS